MRLILILLVLTLTPVYGTRIDVDEVGVSFNFSSNWHLQTKEEYEFNLEKSLRKLPSDKQAEMRELLDDTASGTEYVIVGHIEDDDTGMPIAAIAGFVVISLGDLSDSKIAQIVGDQFGYSDLRFISKGRFYEENVPIEAYAFDLKGQSKLIFYRIRHTKTELLMAGIYETPKGKILVQEVFQSIKNIQPHAGANSDSAPVDPPSTLSE